MLGAGGAHWVLMPPSGGRPHGKLSAASSSPQTGQGQDRRKQAVDLISKAVDLIIKVLQQRLTQRGQGLPVKVGLPFQARDHKGGLHWILHRGPAAKADTEEGPRCACVGRPAI
eukprot:scaffold104832_cov20-Tisochrysis_lutea.AAC.1